MLMHVLGWLYAFLLAAAMSAGITLTPLAVAWGSIWTYITFALCLIPGYIAAWLSIMAIFALLGLLGIGIIGGGAVALSALAERKTRRF